jgi:hypothetical protein
MKPWPFPAHSYRFDYYDVIVNKIRTVNPKNLSLPFVSYRTVQTGKVDNYQLEEIINDYITEPKPFNSLIESLKHSNCPYVAKLRESIAESFSDMNADEMEEFKREHED